MEKVLVQYLNELAMVFSGGSSSFLNFCICVCFHAKFLCCFLATVFHYHIEFSLLLSITALASLPSKRVFKTSLFRTGIASFPLHFDAFLAMLVCVYMCVCVFVLYWHCVCFRTQSYEWVCAWSCVCFTPLCGNMWTVFVCLFVYIPLMCMWGFAHCVVFFNQVELSENTVNSLSSLLLLLLPLTSSLSLPFSPQPFHNKTRTNKKKKEKVNRNRLNLEVNFMDDAERERVGEQDALGDDPEVDVQWSKWDLCTAPSVITWGVGRL